MQIYAEYAENKKFFATVPSDATDRRGDDRESHSDGRSNTNQSDGASCEPAGLQDFGDARFEG